jgi:vacuolar protein sorting-associated protein VTA1
LELSATSRKKETQDYLLQLMDRLEEEKKQLAGAEALTSDDVAKAHIENFGLKIFMNADNQDRSGTASKFVALILSANSIRKTAKTFLAASMFLELLKIFGPLEEEIEQKVKYSKWKTADIVKALKEGRQPQAGPPGGDEEWMNATEDAAPDFLEKPPSPTFPSVPQPGLSASPNMPDVGRVSPTIKSPPTPQPARSGGFTPVPGEVSNGIYPYDPKVLTNAQKHARFAISSLQYDDIETAVDNLKRALSLLEPYRK